MNIHNFPFWISIKKYSEYCGISESKIIRKCKEGRFFYQPTKDEDDLGGGEIKIAIANLPDDIFIQFIIGNGEIKVEPESPAIRRERIVKNNEIIYRNLNSNQRKYVDFWRPKMLEAFDKFGKELRDYCEKKGTTYSSYLARRKKWLASDGSIESFIPKYYWKQKKRYKIKITMPHGEKLTLEVIYRKTGNCHNEKMEQANAAAFKKMKLKMKKYIAFWLPIMLETKTMPRKNLLEYCKTRGISLTTLIRYRKKWDDSKGDIKSLVPANFLRKKIKTVLHPKRILLRKATKNRLKLLKNRNRSELK
jgi:hypothetical protein